MATKSKTTKTRKTPKTVKGTGGLKKNNMNWKFIIVLLLLVTAVGGFFAYRSQVKAASGTIWNVATNNPNPVVNSGGKFPKADGSQGWEGGQGNWIKIRATFTSANIGQKTYCADGKFISYNGLLAARMEYIGSRTAASSGIVNTGSETFKACVTANSNSQIGEYIELYVCGYFAFPGTGKCSMGSALGGVQVQNFYRP